MRYFLFSFTFILCFCTLKTEAQTNVLSTPLSYNLKDNKGGLILKTKSIDKLNISMANLPEFELAKQSGYLLVIKDSSSKYGANATVKTIRTLKNNGYYIYTISGIKNTYFAIPNGLFQNNQYIDYFLDGSLQDEYILYLIDWFDNERELSNSIGDNNKILKAIIEQLLIKETLDHKIDSLKVVTTTLNQDIESLQHQIDLIVLPSLLENKDIRISPLLNRVKERKIPYDINKDFFLEAFKELIEKGLLVDVRDKPWIDKSQVSNPYVNPEMVDIIETINEKEKKALEDIGLFPLTVTSTARTPYNQLVQMVTQPVAASMFGSGHVFGVSFDFANEKAIKKNYSKFKSIVEKYGLYCEPKLKNSDPKHVFLGKFRGPNSSKSFANNIRKEFLKSYNKAMEKERDRQLTMKDKLKDENTSLGNQLKNLDDLIAENQKNIEKLDKEIQNLEAKKNEKKNELNQKQREKAVREAMKRREMGDRGGYRDRMGERGEYKDGYWEKYTHGEAHSSDGSRCTSDKYENSRGDRWERTYCEGPMREGGISREKP